MFDVFENRLTITGIIETQTGMRIGTGRSTEPVGTDLPVLRDAMGRPYIPGSTFKGIVRSTAEQVVRSVIPGLHGACYPTGDDADRCIAPSTMNMLRNAANNDAELATKVLDRSCLVCSTFGSSWLASHVQFRDLYVPKTQWYGQFQVRDGVSIDRDTGAAVDGQLYDYETVPAQTGFDCTITLENCAPWQQGLVWIALQPFIRGQASIGGFRSRGLGWVKLLKPELRLMTLGHDVASLIDNLLGEGISVSETDLAAWRNAIKAKLTETAQAATESYHSEEEGAHA